MRERIEKAVVNIFENYEETTAMQEFQEEIVVNLLDKTNNLIKEKNMNMEDALKTALDELGDITEIADNISRKKRQETIGDFYITRKPLDKPHAIGYSISGVLFLLGIVAGTACLLLNGGGKGNVMLEATWVELTRSLTVAAPFIVLACLGFVFFGLTQETKTNYPMNTKRAIAYSLCTGIVLTGLFSAIIVIFGKVQIGLTSGFSAEEMFNLKSLAIEASPILTVLSAIEILFGLALLAYLILTQEKMQKPWVVEFARKQCQQNNSLYGERFGLICGAIWIAAFAIFLALCLTIGLRLSWLAFPCAIVVQLLVMARLSGDKRNKQN